MDLFEGLRQEMREQACGDDDTFQRLRGVSIKYLIDYVYAKNTIDVRNLANTILEGDDLEREAKRLTQKHYERMDRAALLFEIPLSDRREEIYSKNINELLDFIKEFRNEKATMRSRDRDD